MARTQEQRRADTRARLLAAAATLFAQRGYHAVSAEAVASAADRTTGALYDHFGGKEGLLVALVEQWVGQAVVDISVSLEDEVDLDGRLAALWSGVVAADTDRGGDAWLLLEFELWLHAVRDPALSAVGAERFHVMRAGLASGLLDWSTELGFALPAPAEVLAGQVIALLLGAAFQFRLDPASMPTAVVVDGVRRLLELPTTEPVAPAIAHPPYTSTQGSR